VALLGLLVAQPGHELGDVSRRDLLNTMSRIASEAPRNVVGRVCSRKR
jgi:hypothetical protein